ncbi:carbohydrate ABC transporter permease [Rhodobacteraceae bacterium RKSG542]|uniref:carbohydrate ABC transporter permease n=1 Tax=Pseudovibrio flavus TaxID=2529854 RepID=UPI0012BC750E|nr:carbohydrate ABC transporter permease [Pseudovibrio flavus]MTI18147.1 carbohydrate ABC transporter permease [Pseudovibrio flavus]
MTEVIHSPAPIEATKEQSNSPDWTALAKKATFARRMRLGLLLAFLTLCSLPIVLPYFWMFMISFTAKLGEPESGTMWIACAILGPIILGYGAAHILLPNPKARLLAGVFMATAAIGLLYAFIGSEFHFFNYRFFVTPDLIEGTLGKGTVEGQFPWVWEAFGNSLLLAGAQTAIVVIVSTLAGYYLSRFAFVGRAGFLQSLLVLQAFPAMTLIIPIFLISHYAGLLNTLVAPMLVITALELPFFIFIMKGFFDAVPWDIEMSALVDGASRKEAFAKVVLPQVKVGMMAIAIFAFIKGWEEYIFVSSLRTGSSYWVMSLYLYYVSEDVMGVDYGLVAAVGMFYLMPALLLYVFTQKYLTQMSVGGIKG